MRISDWSSDVCSSDLDPDRGWALAALTDALDFPAVKAGTVRALLGARVDEELFRLSRHFVGDTAETAALLWPEKPLPFREGVGVGRSEERRVGKEGVSRGRYGGWAFIYKKKQK